MNEDQKVVGTSLDWNRSSLMDWKQSLDERERSFKNGMIAKFLMSHDDEDLVVFLSLILFVVPESERKRK